MQPACAEAPENPSPPGAPFVPGAGHARFYQRLQRRYADDLSLLPPGAPVLATMERAYEALRARGCDTASALRVLRQLVMERLMRIDCAAQAPLSEITRAMTELAELALDHACRQARQELDARHGAPCGPQGQPVALWIVGMGKLGARELNVSSDIDLIYVYEQDGETAGTADGRGRISNHEYFARAVKAIYGLIGESTEHGFVFRVDLALRPNGQSGPPAVSLSALEEYLQVQGREWERFAWLKSRVVAPRASIASAGVQALRGVVLPFVFRRYLDYGVFEALRALHRQIREHAAKRSAGHPERANDVKLSRGGIREIEFIVQLLQVVRGGQFPELRCRPTLDALQRLARAALMPPETADALARAYVFLRRVEHRIQYLDDQQTHALPTRDDDLAWIAHTLDYPDCCAFLHALDAHRELVAQEFDTLLGGPGKKPCHGCCAAGAPPPVPELDGLLEQLPPDLRARVAECCRHPRVTGLRDEARARLVRLVQRSAQWVAEGRVSETAAVRLIDWLESLLRRESYLALLLERPAVHAQLLQLLGAARWPARYLLQHPGVIDELAGDALLAERFVAADFERELALRLTALRATGEDDDENLLNLLRRAQHAEIFRTLARDLGRCLTVEQVADDLSALADSVLRVTTQWCWSRLRARHREHPQFAIIGYGKLGGKELGYGSDLDIVFVFDDDDERAPEIYAAFARKLINWLTVKTGEGGLYEIDTALRPNGSAGLLVTRFAAYAAYQQQRGSNTAWTWEHQAMTRARFVLGSDALRARFDAVREAVISAARDPLALRAEIVGMRERVRAAHPTPAGRFDVKHSPGGMVDAEFAVQYLVLSRSAQHPQLLANAGNIALLQDAQRAGLLPAGVGQAAADAYRALRRAQHQARLDETPTQLAPPALQAERDAVLALWHAVLGAKQEAVGA
ncbi:bifunctional [glutamate--ammonia ligase]-adenylyl-L-tyrosine phosphorylase/[glutamate--ammonia-ligase] adenylyltransferase [Verminephrobacter aporrectodeae subsp. tuberculatae]|uniref:bifunctional [glutamate--ammonia ligase]-adenylyl-L-tyrosine phosphorylase/[glutamate--ammonia-ligase] adenylyltransferase n=1 Tax=Verminephrobacter aporrectodeae TaxID=1110389 RepID=UPI00223895E9|nr:bifunctional [glutamate--ammonia ligase]-adenylyl-L-tyrosine phosphorylase/[glutamate--ammonia-ligase] adenylyltransferase [Verminephrobacter aporrectodeae]MCW5221185.1 bifunctional [glutamate--ammonia ligase]-adenylyl-L-tyrosine phosphorylase/[glutamate--ammonia-ligase] adenylyltransferase [Verminephrobacter aporrectodeae subsp. tuberculatae]MCW5290476.1 bifunctional [glutamate--ammonia ligase]-adenylyl-L-tyrosine phosphorylase/[glutamate--ammonia-ligase] adenylyltransferase [Verminephrobacte